MGLYDDLQLDKHVSRNTFTKEDAIKVYEKMIADLKSANATAKTVEKIVDGAFIVLKVVAALA